MQVKALPIAFRGPEGYLVTPTNLYYSLSQSGVSIIRVLYLARYKTPRLALQLLFDYCNLRIDLSLFGPLLTSSSSNQASQDTKIR